jgi:hypothetical protein
MYRMKVNNYIDINKLLFDFIDMKINLIWLILNGFDLINIKRDN